MIWAVLVALLFFPVVGVAEEAPLDEVEVPAPKNAPSVELIMQGMGMISSITPAAQGRLLLTLDVIAQNVWSAIAQVEILGSLILLGKTRASRHGPFDPRVAQ